MGGIVFDEQITAGTVLVREAIQSPDYVPGVSGWQININGNAEFSSGTFRGTISASSFVTGTSGRRIEINVADSQAMVFYDNSDNAILMIGDQSGAVTSYDSAFAGNAINLVGAQLQFLWSGGGGIYTPMAFMENNASSVFLNTQLAGGVAFDAVHAALSWIIPGSNTLESWRTPAYSSANWLDSSTFNGSTTWGPLRFRRDSEDNIHFSGCFKAGAVAPSLTIMTLPVGLRPTRQEPIWVQRNNAATLTGGYASVGTSGNFNLMTATGLAVVAGNEFLVQGHIPLHNLT